MSGPTTDTLNFARSSLGRFPQAAKGSLMPDRPAEIQITPEMIETGGKVLRAFLWQDGLSYGESENLAERVLRAVLLRGAPTTNSPRESS
jgi:hypothetical protein